MQWVVSDYILEQEKEEIIIIFGKFKYKLCNILFYQC